MKFNKDDVLEALGIEERFGFTEALIGFGLGAVVGATVALLLAPKRGEELRGDIVERARGVIGRGREMARDVGVGGENIEPPRNY